MITLYGRATSFNVLKVGWLLDELRLEYDHVSVGGRFGGLDTVEYGKINPIRKVPTLVDDGRTVWESHSILRYLADQYGADGFYPADPYERSLQVRWMDWSQSVFQPAFISVFWGYYRKAPSKRDMSFVDSNLDKCKFHLEALNQQLSGSPFLAGDTFSVADIPAGSVLYRLVQMGLPVELPQHVDRWYVELQKRPGYQTWVMADFSELKAREGY